VDTIHAVETFNLFSSKKMSLTTEVKVMKMAYDMDGMILTDRVPAGTTVTAA
jgi:hypothetical protein